MELTFQWAQRTMSLEIEKDKLEVIDAVEENQAQSWRVTTGVSLWIGLVREGLLRGDTVATLNGGEDQPREGAGKRAPGSGGKNFSEAVEAPPCPGPL